MMNEIPPAPAPISLNDISSKYESFFKDETAYASNELFPSDWYSYHIGCGLNADNEPVTFVTLCR